MLISPRLIEAGKNAIANEDGVCAYHAHKKMAEATVRAVVAQLEAEGMMFVPPPPSWKRCRDEHFRHFPKSV